MQRKIGKLSAQAAVIALVSFSCALSSCAKNKLSVFEATQVSLMAQLDKNYFDSESSFAIVNQIATNYISANDYANATIFLTDWVTVHPDDKYAAYWLLMTAHAYLSQNTEPIAEYYFERIISEYPDLLVRGNSIHYICLTNLIRMSQTSKNRIKYLHDLIEKFSDKVSVTELYLRLAMEYEKENEWEQSMRYYSLFVRSPDAPTIQIAGEPDAYKKARQLVSFNESKKDWTFESIGALEKAVKNAIANYDWVSLEKCRSKVNFFSMSWLQDETDANAQKSFTMRNYMRGNKISVATSVEESATPNEVYLRTWGWNQYVSVWYLCFRRVNFPSNPDIHGNWEWAGIYMGERL